MTDPKPADFRTGIVAVVGRPNVGKSTLLNALLSFKLSIVAAKAQTTRHRIMGVHTRADAQLIYLDTPGLHIDMPKAINRQLNRAARVALAEADVIVFMVDGVKWLPEDEHVWQLAKAIGKPVVLAVNKIDRLEDKERLLPFLAKVSEGREFVDVVPISAKNKSGCEQLENLVVSLLPIAPPVYADDEITDRSEKFLVAELVREQVVRQLHDELPYATTVEIEKFERIDGIAHIAAVIWLERQGQKGIVVGAGGERMKKIGTEARKSMEKLLGQKVFLQLWAKVRENWSDDESSLRRFGYED